MKKMCYNLSVRIFVFFVLQKNLTLKGRKKIMFSLVLIDDEPFQLNRLKALLDWEKLGFTLKKSFFNPQEALEYLKSNTVDLVITDVSMPIVSGIDIANYLHHTQPETKIIFLSAYEDFEYAKQAISCGVFSYLVKPITITTLTDVMAKVYVALNKQHIKNPFKDDHLHTTIRQCFIDIVEGNDTNNQNPLQVLNGLGFDIDASSVYFAALSVSISDSENYYNSIWLHGKERLIMAIEQIVNNEHLQAYSGITYFYEDSFDMLIISRPNVNKKQFAQFINAYINSLSSTFKDCLGMDVNIRLKIITNTGSDLCTFSGDSSKKRRTINEINKTQMFDDVKKYIESNYAENISLDKIAAEIGFNPAYFSILFKEHFGTNFINYLCNTRIEAAKKLLMDSDTKITSIYSMVGFSQHPYFAKQFKAYTGYTPIEYRNKYRKL